MNRTEQAEAVKAAQNGDKEAFERLYGEYRDKLYFFVLKNIGRRETAEDIVSETFLAAMERINELRAGEAFGAWLYSVAYKKCADCIKDSSRTAHFESDDERDITIADSALNEPIQLPEDYAVNKQRGEQLKGIIDSLKPDMKSAVILYYYDELPLKEVAKALGTTENAAKKRLFDARKKIRSKVEKLIKGGAFCAVPISSVLDSLYDAKTASAAKGVTVVSGTSAAKIISVSAALVMAAGLPVGLYAMNKGWSGDGRTDSERSIVRDKDEQLYADSDLPELIEAGNVYEFRRRLTGNCEVEDIRGDRAIITDMDGYRTGFAVNAKTGMTDLDGNWLIPADNRGAEFTKAGYVRLWLKDSGYMYCDMDGSEVARAYDGFIKEYEGENPDEERQFGINDPEGRFSDYTVHDFCNEDKTMLLYKDDSVIWVNESGEVIAEITGEIYDGCYTVDSPDGLASVNGGRAYYHGEQALIEIPTFHNGYCSVPHDSKCGLVDTKGNVAVDYAYDEIKYLEDDVWFLVDWEDYYLYDTSLGGEPLKLDLPKGKIEFFGKRFCVKTDNVSAIYELNIKK